MTSADAATAPGPTLIDAAELRPVEEPRVERPAVPDGYGLPADGPGLQTWAQALDRLTAAEHYWLGSVRPDGTPHAVPRWGVWVDGRFFYDGSPLTRHARNVQAHPACTLTLESGTDVVIVEGDSVAVRADPADVGARLSAAFGKYAVSGYAPEPDAWSDAGGGGLRVITPRRALAWASFPTDCTRFVF